MENKGFNQKEELKKFLCMSGPEVDRLQFCMMEKPTNRREEFIYGLFIAVGTIDPPETIYEYHRERCRSRSAYSFTTPAGFNYMPGYDPEDALRIAVPYWALIMASKCEGLYNMAHDKGHREGFEKGYNRGSNQLMRVFNGELFTNDFERYDWKTDRDNLQLRYTWDLKRWDEK